MAGMPKPRYAYVQKETTRHGKTTWYFRVGDGKRVRLPDEYGSPEFVAAWQNAMSGHALAPAPKNRNTLGWLVDQYKQSAAFKTLKESTQRSRANILKSVCATGGDLLISQIDRAAIAKGRDRRADTPFAAINYLKIMGYLFEWAVDAGYVDTNPVRGVKHPKVRTLGHKAWTFDDVVKFYQRHPIGTMQRLSMDLLLYTGLRRSDVYRLGPQHVKDGVIEFRAEKNAEMVYIPIHPALANSIAATKTGHLAFILTPDRGKPFRSEASFGNFFGDACREAGLDVRAHGLRKTLAEIVAEMGASNATMRAMFGWKNDTMPAHYSRGANRKKMSTAGFEKLKENTLSPHLEFGAGLASKNETDTGT